MEENAVEMFHHHGVHLSSSFLFKISSPLRENNILEVFEFPFQIVMLFAYLWLIVSHPKDKKLP